MFSSRWWPVVALVGTGLAGGLGQWRTVTAAQPHQPQPVVPGPVALSSADAQPVTIPRVHLEIASRRGLVSARQPTGYQTDRADTRAAPSAIGPDRTPVAQAGIPVAAAATPPSADGVPLARAPATVPQLMVCHADARGPYGAADVLQECIERAPAYSSVEIPPGVYVLHRRIVVSTPLTIRTAGTRGSSVPCTTAPDRCAWLVAAPDFREPWGVLLVNATNNVTIEHLVIDGNQAARGASTAARSCITGPNIFGFNASVLRCLNCSVADVLSRNALCGTGMVWVGGNASIQRSTFQGNGNASTRMWSDGLTMLYAPQSEIVDNQFLDNSDVALIFGYGVSSRIERNVVRQRAQPAFAGLMLHNFGARDLKTSGDFRGAVIAGNTIDCGPQLCVFGIEIGPGPWNGDRLIVVGGDVRDNVVRGARVGINVDSAGILRAPVVLRNNEVSGVPSGTLFQACARPIAAGDMNISPTSVVDRGDDTSPAASYLSDWCQLLSGLTPEDR